MTGVGKRVFQKEIIFGARSGADFVVAAYEGAGVLGQIEDLGGGAAKRYWQGAASWILRCMSFQSAEVESHIQLWVYSDLERVVIATRSEGVYQN
jgi:hypothetical protein